LKEKQMSEDPRCCGTGTCIIDPEGRCWCGQVWDGEKMAMPKLELSSGEAQDKSRTDSSGAKAST
jgi:hypothetical protein